MLILTANVQIERKDESRDPRSRMFKSHDRHLRVLLVALSAIFVAGVAFAQDKTEVIRVETELVSFEVTVTDPRGKPINGLQSSDFRILENGKERQIDFFQPIRNVELQRPLVVVFALDVSGSMTEAELDRLRSAMDQFIARLANPDSYFAVVAFAMDVKTVQDLTNRREKIERSLGKIAKDRSGLSTHAYDAVDHAIRMIERRSPRSIRSRIPKRAVVVISDGFPVGDVVAPRTVIERAQAADVSVFSVIMPSYSRLQGSKRPLMTPFESSGIVSRTGGVSFYANENDLDPLFKALAEQITSSYVVAFYPDENDPEDYRRVKVESKSGFVVKQNRTGYTLKRQE